jgi:hypothetical protein
MLLKMLKYIYFLGIFASYVHIVETLTSVLQVILSHNTGRWKSVQIIMDPDPEDPKVAATTESDPEDC